ncbi:Mediator of RNA polymerase II transcription subunit 12 [Operophtera brumata]|uniref:Mediator of RNA polymerase II transcription subunit 12 n=1 Tax=Operophtera brumata TaxID=104452 RepID=A0A0L7KT66_OPEBR|nr:Mediator of RNA polymerase II transcription subunit 12 [Operophtera brumata]
MPLDQGTYTIVFTNPWSSQAMSMYEQGAVSWAVGGAVCEALAAYAAGATTYLPQAEHILKELSEVEAALISRGAPSICVEQTSAVFEQLCRLVKCVVNPGDCGSAERCVLAQLHDLVNELGVLCAEMTAWCSGLAAEWLGALVALCGAQHYPAGTAPHAAPPPLYPDLVDVAGPGRRGGRLVGDSTARDGGKPAGKKSCELSHILGTSDTVPIDTQLDHITIVESESGGHRTPRGSGGVGSTLLDSSQSLSSLARRVLADICSEEWVLQKCLQNPDELYQNDMLLDSMLTPRQAQRLLHMICYPDSASHTHPDLDQKTMITRLLENLEQWSLRMSWLDLQLMFKQFPSGSSELSAWLDTVARAVINVSSGAGSGGKRGVGGGCSCAGGSAVRLANEPLLSLLQHYLTHARDHERSACNDTWQDEVAPEALQLRFSLAGGMFDAIRRSYQLTSDWAVLLTQLCLTINAYSLSRSNLFTTLIDMLATLIHSTLADGGDDNNRKHFQALMKKLKKEIGDRQGPSVTCVRQLLPLSKNTIVEKE